VDSVSYRFHIAVAAVNAGAAVAPCTLSHAAPHSPPSPAPPRAERSHFNGAQSSGRSGRVMRRMANSSTKSDHAQEPWKARAPKAPRLPDTELSSSRVWLAGHGSRAPVHGPRLIADTTQARSAPCLHRPSTSSCCQGDRSSLCTAVRARTTPSRRLPKEHLSLL
jgi:hypothetical protein